MGTKGKDFGPKMKILNACMVKYHNDKSELLFRAAAFMSYTAEIVKQVVSTKSMHIVCTTYISPWTTHMLYIRDMYVKVYLGACIRKSFEEVDSDYIGKLRPNNVIKVSDEDYCEGMSDFPFSICSNYGLTRYLNEFNEGAHGFDVVSNKFECNDDDFGKVRSTLNRSIEEVEKVLRERTIVTRVSISKLEATSALSNFELVIEQSTGARVSWGYDTKKGKDNKAPTQYIVYSSANKVLYTSEVFQQSVSGGRNNVKTSNLRGVTSATTLTPAFVATINKDGKRKNKQIVTSPESDCGDNIATVVTMNQVAIVSDEKDNNPWITASAQHNCQDAHTKRLTSDVSSPTQGVDGEEEPKKKLRTSPPSEQKQDESTCHAPSPSQLQNYRGKNTPVEPTKRSSHLLGGVVVSQQTINPADLHITAGPQKATIAPSVMLTPPSLFKTLDGTGEKMMHNQLPNPVLPARTNNYCSASRQEQEQGDTSDASSVSHFSPTAYSVDDDYLLEENGRFGVDGEGDFNDTCVPPARLSDCIIYKGPHLSQMDDEHFFKQVYGLVVDELRAGVKLESILTAFFQRRKEEGLNLDMDWIAFGYVLAEYAIEQFGEQGMSSDGLKKTKSSCRKGIPKEDRVLMTKHQYNANNNLNRRIRAAAKKIVKCIVNIWPLLCSSSSDGINSISVVNLNKDTQGLWNALTSGGQSEENMFVSAIKQTSAETMCKVSKVLALANRNYIKLPKNLEAGMTSVNKKIAEAELCETPLSEKQIVFGEESPDNNSQSSSTTGTMNDAIDTTPVLRGGGQYSHIDDDEELIKSYSEKKRKMVKEPDDHDDDAAGDATEEDCQTAPQDFPFCDADVDYFDNRSQKQHHDDDDEEEQDEENQINDEFLPNDISTFADEYHQHDNSKSGLTPVDRDEYFLRASELLEDGILDLQWGVDLFLDAVCARQGVTSNGQIFLREEFSDLEWATWSNAVHVARRLADKLDIDCGACTEPMRYKLMQAFAHTSVENDVMKKILLPLVVKYQGSDILDTPLSYGANEDYRFVLIKICVGKDNNEDEIIESRQFNTSFSFFHTKKFQDKLKRLAARKKINGSAVFSPLSSEC